MQTKVNQTEKSAATRNKSQSGAKAHTGIHHDDRYRDDRYRDDRYRDGHFTELDRIANSRDKHLHEAWHVVQQKQDRVKPTLQMKGKVNINDDKGLEKEADVMGGRALKIKSASKVTHYQTNRTSTIQRINNKQAINAFDNEELVWYKDGDEYVQVRIIEKARGGQKNIFIRLMDGKRIDVPLTTLKLTNPNDQSTQAVGIKGINTPGPSRPVEGQNVINRGIVETELVNGVPHVRVYSGLMGSVGFDTEDETTGVATSAYKDIHQKPGGKITISSGNNSVLWAGMGRPLRALKWSEKYFAQILDEKPELQPLYKEYKNAVDDVEKQNDRIQNLTRQINIINSELQVKIQRWTGKRKSATRRQQRALNLLSRQIGDLESHIQQAKKEIQKNERVIKKAKATLGKDANPVIRSFLIPFSSFEKISKRAMPEELNAVFSKGEEAHRITTLATATIRKVDLLLEQKSRQLEISRKTFAKAEYFDKSKKLTKRQRKARDLNYKQAENAKHEVTSYEKLILAELHKFELAVDPNKKEKTAIKAHEVKGHVENIYNKEFKTLLALARKSMPDLEVTKITPTGIIEAMKERELDTRSINVDRHYEPNQFGIKGPDIDLLRRSAVPGSLKTYAMFPENMSETRKRESGEVHHTDELRDKLGVPKDNLSDSPWLQGSDFAKQKKFEGEADKLSMYYSTWLKSKNSKFDESALLAPKLSKIPLKNRVEMLKKFLQENGITRDKTDDFMNKVVGPWASQSMISHVMAEDYDRMNKDQNIVEKTSGQDFAKMRYDLPERRNKLKETGEKLDVKISENVSPKELLDILIKDFPELKARFAKISAKSEQFSFYDHAQMVYQQFQKLSHEDEDGNRLLSKQLIGKMILFHDMEKWNSKEQYGKEGEHKLTIDEMHNYKELWGNKRNANIAKTLVNSDHFGDYMKGKITKEEAHQEITAMAKKLGFAPSKYKQFFKEYHQFYQSDFSSYTDKVQYTTMDGKTVTGKPVFNKFFDFDTKMDGRFKYTNNDAKDLEKYETKFTELEALFG